MEFHEKLQDLRKKKGLTQEELAGALYVSRTAISKWESGRGYPNLDSLKAIAKFFSITIDELLSGEEVVTIAKEEQKQKAAILRNMVFGLLDLGVATVFFIPFFGQKTDGYIRAVSLFSLTGIASYLKIAYFAVVIGMIACGILNLAFQNYQGPWGWMKNKNIISLVLNGIGVLLLTISSQPYAATFFLLFLTIKVLMLIKKQ